MWRLRARCCFDFVMTHEEVIETARREFRRMKQLAERAIA
jgi:hypothetical protein